MSKHDESSLINYLVSFDYLYRLRLLLSVCLMFYAVSLAVATCFGSEAIAEAVWREGSQEGREDSEKAEDNGRERCI